MKYLPTISALLLLSTVQTHAQLQTVSVGARVQLYLDHNSFPEKNNSDVAVWLEPLNSASAPDFHRAEHFDVIQKGHAFAPHVLIVPVGAKVEFPNHDLAFHNAFSLFEGKRFDLGLYEAGTSKGVKFDRPGVAYIFCNIHYEMSAIVIALSTPYYGLTDRKGMVKITGVPLGEYRLRVWAEGTSADRLNRLSRELHIERDSFLGTIRIETAPAITMPHTNKYGLPYDTQSSENLYGH